MSPRVRSGGRPLQLSHLIGAVAIVVVLILCVVHLHTNVLGGSVGQRPTLVTLQMDETGGLFESSAVTYRGVRVGKVETISLAEGGVEARLRINPGVEVPASAVAVVRSLSPAGEQYVDLQPTSETGDALADGARIREVTTPPSIAGTLRAIDGLMGQVDDDDLRVVLGELGKAFADPDDLQRIITASQQLVDTLDAAWPETLRVLQNGNTVLRTADDLAPQVREFSASARELATWLEGYDPTIDRTLDAAPAQLAELERLVNDTVEALPKLLPELAGFGEVFAKRDQSVRQLLKEFPGGIGQLSGAFKDGRLQTYMLLSLGDVCSYGIEDADPQDETRPPLVLGRTCADPAFPAQQRGSAYAPGPTR